MLIFLQTCAMLFGINQKRGPAYPTISTLRFWKTLQKDHETTCPRIYVNRRTPSCSNFEFSRFRHTRQKRVASFTIKSTADARKARAVRKAVPLRTNFLCAKVRNNSELFGFYKKNVLFCSYIQTSMPFSMKTCTSLVIRI